jgi:hypothetical protein
MWYSYTFGFAYSLILGHLAIALVMPRMWDCIEREPGTDESNELERAKKTDDWQPPITGTVERTLYVSSLLMNHGEFIGLWLVLKVTVAWGRWGKGHSGRTIYMGSLIGSALSVLYAVVGFQSIKWIEGGKWFPAAAVPILLWLGSAVLWNYLGKHKKTT